MAGPRPVGEVHSSGAPGPGPGTQSISVPQCTTQITSWTTHQLLPPHHGMAGLPTWGAYAGGGPATQARRHFCRGLEWGTLLPGSLR